VRPEQARFFRAYLRAVPWALAAGMAGLGLWFLLRPPAWVVIPLLLIPPVAVLLVLPRKEWLAMMAPAREARAARIARGEPPPFRPTPLQWLLLALRLVTPLVGAALLMLGHGAVKYAGVVLLVLYVLDSAVLSPLRTARRQERARRAR
jgi:hypothetical protein